MRSCVAVLGKQSCPGKRTLPGPGRTSQPHMRAFKAFVLATFVLGVVLRVPTFCRPLLSDDEAIYATTADALARGGLLYRDVVDHKPPLIYHVYQAGFALFGRYDMHGAHALVVLSVLLTAGFLFAIKWQRGTRPRRNRWLFQGLRPGGGWPVPGVLDDLARLRCARGELRAVLAGATGDRRLVAAAGSSRGRSAASPCRGRGDPSGRRRADWNVRPVQVSGSHLSRCFDGHARLVGDPRTSLLVVGGDHGGLSGGRRPGAAHALPFLVRGGGQRRGRGLLVQVQFLIRPCRLDGARGDRPRIAPDGAHRWGGSRPLRPGRLGGGCRGVGHGSRDPPPAAPCTFVGNRRASALGGAGPALAFHLCRFRDGRGTLLRALLPPDSGAALPAGRTRLLSILEQGLVHAGAAGGAVRPAGDVLLRAGDHRQAARRRPGRE